MTTPATTFTTDCEAAVEYEKAVLSAILQNDKFIPPALALLSSEQFYDITHRNIFDAIKIMWQKNRKIDFITILEYAGNNIENKKYISYLIDTLPYTSEEGLKEYCRLVADSHKARTALAILRMTDLTKLSSGDITANIHTIIERLSEIIKDKSSSYFRSAHREMTDIFNNLSNGVVKKGRIDTGIKQLDDILDGIYPSDLITIAAGTGVGKTAFMLEIAKNIALAGKKVLLYTLEMSSEQNVQRLMSNHSGISLKSIKNGVGLTHEQLEKLHKTTFEFSQADFNLYINDSGSTKVSDIRLDLMSIPDADVVIVDHIGLMSGENPVKRSRYEEITQIVIDLKALAARLGKPVIVLCQLNRSSAPVSTYARDKASVEPQLYHLRDSGEVEQSSSSVIMLWKLPDYEYTGKIGVKVAKNRQGDTGKFAMKFKPHTMRYEPAQHNFNNFEAVSNKI